MRKKEFGVGKAPQLLKLRRESRTPAPLPIVLDATPVLVHVVQLLICLTPSQTFTVKALSCFQKTLMPIIRLHRQIVHAKMSLQHHSTPRKSRVQGTIDFLCSTGQLGQGRLFAKEQVFRQLSNQPRNWPSYTRTHIRVRSSALDDQKPHKPTHSRTGNHYRLVRPIPES